ncbi:MAG: DUF6599 family protein [Polyangiaceae bacterium]
MRSFVVVSSLAICSILGCTKPDAGSTPPPPPPPIASGGGAAVCASGGGTDTDAVSAPFFPRTIGAYCIDPQGDIKTYGEQGKLTMDDVCTTAFDGECEVYKQFGLKRVVALRYVNGNGGSVEINLSRFANDDGAFGMYTKRVVADGDPTDSHAPRPIDASGAGAMGSGRGYAWRGSYLVELTYLNETETPQAMIASSEQILPTVAKVISEKLPGATDKPISARALSTTNLIPNGIAYFPQDPLQLGKIGAGAIGYYKDGTKRYRMLAVQEADVDSAKDAMKTIRGRAGVLPIAALGDEAVLIAIKDPPDATTKVEWVIARKGALIAGVGGEPLTDSDATTKVTKDDKVSHLRAWLNSSPAPAPASSK